MKNSEWVRCDDQLPPMREKVSVLYKGEILIGYREYEQGDSWSWRVIGVDDAWPEVRYWNTQKLVKPSKPDIIKKLLGKVGVDSGLIWIGDPCYILADKKRGKSPEDSISYSELLDLLDNSEPLRHCSVPYPLGHEGLGVCSTTYEGDGTYPVYGYFRNGENRPFKIEIDFQSDESEANQL